MARGNDAALTPAELRTRRRALGLTQAALARGLGVAANTVARWERGERPVGAPELVRLALERLESSRARPQPLAVASRPGLTPSPPPAGTSTAVTPAALTNARSTLPDWLTSFVGRERELAAVRRLLNANRLLTLVGPAGIGKTRLALQLAANSPGAVRWVELASGTHPGQVTRAVASALGVMEPPGRPLVETLVQTLQEGRLLLVFDNCEHLIETAAALADRLLSACPRLRLLATSREALGIAGEATWRVPPLMVPDLERQPRLEDLARSEAVQLFVERASAASQFALTEYNAPLVAELCRRLDGMPLAVELAAARAGVFGMDELVARLDDRFRLLVSSGRQRPARQQTLRAAVDWSYDLLTEPERRLFERLSTFMGGWTLEAAESVTSGDGVEPAEVADLLGQLVAKSVAVSEPTADGVMVRYRLLETLRQYGQERLGERGELDDARSRHARYYLHLAEHAAGELWEASGLRWLAQLDAEKDNLHAALSWSLEADPDLALSLASSLWGFWLLRGHLVEGDHWMQAVLVRPSHATAARAKALLRACPIAVRLAENARAEAWLEEGCSIFRSLDSATGCIQGLHGLAGVACLRARFDLARQHLEQAQSLAQHAGLREEDAAVMYSLGVVAYFEGEFDRAQTLLEASLALFGTIDARTPVLPLILNLGSHIPRERRQGRWRIGWEDTLCLFREHRAASARGYVLASLGSLARVRGEHERAYILLRESLACFQRANDRHGAAQVLGQLGNLAICTRDYLRARRLFEDSLALRRALGDGRGIGLAQLGLAEVALAEADRHGARALYEESLRQFRAMGDRPGIPVVLQDLAELALAEGAVNEAERLLQETLSISTPARRLVPGSQWSWPGLFHLRGRPGAVTPARSSTGRRGLFQGGARTPAALERRTRAGHVPQGSGTGSS